MRHPRLSKSISIFSIFLVLLYSVLAYGAHNTYALNIIQTINVTQWNPNSIEPGGIGFLANGNLIVCDGEIDESSQYQGVNVWYMNKQGVVQETHDTTHFTNEPTGCSVNPTNGNLFFSADDGSDIFEVDLGPDDTFNTSDDVITVLNGNAYGTGDEEEVAYANGKLVIGDGFNNKVHVINSGQNGIFDGVPSDGGDDVVEARINVLPLGITDPEGVGYNPDNNSLFVVGRKSEELAIEMTMTGTLLQSIDLTAANLSGPGGVAYGPRSNDSTQKSLYIADRDGGRIVEIALETGATPTPTVPTNTPTPTIETTPTPIASPSPTLITTPTATPTPGAGIVHQGTITKIGTNVSTLTTGSVAGGTDQLYVVSVSNRSNRNVTAVSGLGLTWTERRQQCSARSQQGIEVWTAFGSPSAGTVTITFASSTKAAVATVSRYSGADTANPVSTPTGQNTLGLNGACSGGTDNTSAALTLTSTENGSVHFVVTNSRNKTISSADPDYTQRAVDVAGGSGDMTRAYVHDRLLTTAGTDSANHTISGTADWATNGIVINSQ